MTKTEGWSTVRNAVGYAVLRDFNNVTEYRDVPVAMPDVDRHDESSQSAVICRWQCRVVVTTLS
jgi:hypothetical protein